MKSIKIVESEKYLPEIEIDNEFYNRKFNIDNNWIVGRTGIEKNIFQKKQLKKWQ